MPNNTMMSVHMHAAIYACLHECKLFSCIQRPSSLSNLVWSERSKVYMELWDHTGCVWPNNPTQIHKLASCILEIFVCYIVMSTINDRAYAVTIKQLMLLWVMMIVKRKVNTSFLSRLGSKELMYRCIIKLLKNTKKQ